MFKDINIRQFDADENIVFTTDVAPHISVDSVSMLNKTIKGIADLLGVSELEPVPAGASVKTYKMTVTELPEQVGEGEEITLTKVKREVAKTYDMTLKKFRKQTSAESIQVSGQDVAINQTDAKVIGMVRKAIKGGFFGSIATPDAVKAEGTGLQAALADGWAKLVKAYDDEELDLTPIYFVAAQDVADYVGSNANHIENIYGFSVLKNFLGIGDAIVMPSLVSGKAYATAKENLHCAFVHGGNSEVAKAFNLTSDETGLVGMTHKVNTNNASIDTLIMSCVQFYPELADGVVEITIKAPVTEP